MCQKTETDTFIALGDAFQLVVAATCGRALERVLATAREEDRRQLVMRKGGIAHDRER